MTMLAMLKLTDCGHFDNHLALLPEQVPHELFSWTLQLHCKVRLLSQYVVCQFVFRLS